MKVGSSAEVNCRAGLVGQTAERERRRSRPSVSEAGNTVRPIERQEHAAEGSGAGALETRPDRGGRRCGVRASRVRRTVSPLQANMGEEAGSWRRTTMAGMDPSGMGGDSRGRAEWSYGEGMNPGARGGGVAAPGRQWTAPRRWARTPGVQGRGAATPWGSMKVGASTRLGVGWRGVGLAARLQEGECATCTQLECREPPRPGIDGSRSKDPAPTEPRGGGAGGGLKARWKPKGGGGADVDGPPRRPIGERVGGGPALRSRGWRPCRGREGGEGGGGQVKWYEGSFPPRGGEEEGGKVEDNRAAKEVAGVAARARGPRGEAAVRRRRWGPPRTAPKRGIGTSGRNSHRQPVTGRVARPRDEAREAGLHGSCGWCGRTGPSGSALESERGKAVVKKERKVGAAEPALNTEWGMAMECGGASQGQLRNAAEGAVRERRPVVGEGAEGQGTQLVDVEREVVELGRRTVGESATHTQLECREPPRPGIDGSR